MTDTVQISLRGTLFTIQESDIQKFPTSFLNTIITSPIGESLKIDGAYFFDRRSESFDRIIDYMHSGFFTCRGLNEYHEESVRQNLTFFRITLEGAELDEYVSLKDIDTEEDTPEVALMSCSPSFYSDEDIDNVYGCKGRSLLELHKNGTTLTLSFETSEIVFLLRVSIFEEFTYPHILSFTNNKSAKLWVLQNGTAKLVKPFRIEGDQVVCGVEVIPYERNLAKVFCFGTVNGSVEICVMKRQSETIQIWRTLSEASVPADVFCTIIQINEYICAGSIGGAIKIWKKPKRFFTEDENNKGNSIYHCVNHFHKSTGTPITKIVGMDEDAVLLSFSAGQSDISVFILERSHFSKFKFQSKYETRSVQQVDEKVNSPIIDMIFINATGGICCLVGDKELSIVILQYRDDVVNSFHRHKSVSIDTRGIISFPFSRCSLLEVKNWNAPQRNSIFLSYRRQFIYENSRRASNLIVQNGDGDDEKARVFLLSFASAGTIGEELRNMVWW
jgi:WD40 repeat protein